MDCLDCMKKSTKSKQSWRSVGEALEESGEELERSLEERSWGDELEKS